MSKMEYDRRHAEQFLEDARRWLQAHAATATKEGTLLTDSDGGGGKTSLDLGDLADAIAYQGW